MASKVCPTAATVLLARFPAREKGARAQHRRKQLWSRRGRQKFSDGSWLNSERTPRTVRTKHTVAHIGCSQSYVAGAARNLLLPHAVKLMYKCNFDCFLWVYNTWSLTARLQRTARVFENKVMARKCRHKEEVIRVWELWRKFHSEELQAFSVESLVFN